VGSGGLVSLAWVVIYVSRLLRTRNLRSVGTGEERQPEGENLGNYLLYSLKESEYFIREESPGV